MPAHRSRTDRWRESLHQIIDRRGGIEFSVARPESGPGADRPDLVWRVRLLAMNEQELLLEVPVTMGRSVTFAPGVRMVVVFAVGQNRWMFTTTVRGRNDGPSPFGEQPGTLRFAVPDSVARCTRREFLRTPVATLRLPEVSCWPLIDPTTAGPAEVASRVRILDLQQGRRSPVEGVEDQSLLPEVGPAFTARLVNIGGGGVGLMVSRDEAHVAASCKFIWLRVDLAPGIPAPLGLTGRICHTHLDSEGNLYLGIAFEFGFNPAHKDFVVAQITGYVDRIQGDARNAA